MVWGFLDSGQVYKWRLGRGRRSVWGAFARIDGKILPILERAFFPSKTKGQERIRRKEWGKEKAWKIKGGDRSGKIKVRVLE